MGLEKLLGYSICNSSSPMDVLAWEVFRFQRLVGDEGVAQADHGEVRPLLRPAGNRSAEMEPMGHGDFWMFPDLSMAIALSSYKPREVWQT